MLAIPPRYATQDILFLTQLIETGTYRPVIDRCYPLEQVIDATRYVETQQKTGNVVLTIGDSHTEESARSSPDTGVPGHPEAQNTTTIADRHSGRRDTECLSMSGPERSGTRLHSRT